MRAGAAAQASEAADLLARENAQHEATRSELAERYLRQLRAVPGLHCPRVPEGFTCSWQMFTVQVDPSLRNDLLHHLRGLDEVAVRAVLVAVLAERKDASA